MSGGSGSEANSILGIRYGKHAGYERVVVDLGVGNKPAGKVPKWELLSPGGDGFLRVTLPSASMTKVSDGSFDSTRLKDYHVVRAPESGMFVDFFVRSGFVYRVIELRNPARLVIDFKASDASLRFPLPAESENTVLVEPRRGAGASGPLLVNGYSRNPEGRNTIILKDSSGKVLLQRTVASNDWSSTWGYFETTIDLPSFSGKATLQVGTKSARDGSFSGVSVPISGG